MAQRRSRLAAGVTKGDAWEGTGGGESCGGGRLEIEDSTSHEGERCGKLKLEVSVG